MKCKKTSYIFLLVTLSMVIGGCGITEELEQAKNTVGEVKNALTEQQDYYNDLAELIEKIPESFSEDMEEVPKTGLFQEEEGALYENFQERNTLFKEMSKKEKEIVQSQKSLEKVMNKKAVDVDNHQLKLIIQSMDIILSNFESLELYIKTGLKQEENLYNELPVDDMEEQIHIIERTYGSIHMVGEEAEANIDYTLSLIKTFEKEAQKSKK